MPDDKSRGGPDPSRPSRTGTVLAKGRDPEFVARPPAEETGHDLPGRNARKPSQFTWSDWMAIFKRTFAELSADNLTLVAAGVAFYAMLALFPGIAALVMFYGLFSDPATIQDHLSALQRFVPPEAFGLIEDQLKQVAGGGRTALGIGSILSLLLAIWSAKAGVSALITGLNIVYDEDDERGIVASLAIAFTLTLLLLVVATVAFGVVVAAPVVLDLLPLGPVATWAAAILRWPVMLAAVILAIGALYRWGPSRADARISWISWGAAIAAVVWVAGSGLFSLYVSNFANYNETYGSLGAVVGLLMWFWLSAFIVLLGAELNAEMEHHTRADTTTGPDKPMGERGAYVADSVAD